MDAEAHLRPSQHVQDGGEAGDHLVRHGHWLCWHCEDGTRNSCCGGRRCIDEFLWQRLVEWQASVHAEEAPGIEVRPLPRKEEGILCVLLLLFLEHELKRWAIARAVLSQLGDALHQVWIRWRSHEGRHPGNRPRSLHAVASFPGPIAGLSVHCLVSQRHDGFFSRQSGCFFFPLLPLQKRGWPELARRTPLSEFLPFFGRKLTWSQCLHHPRWRLLP